MAEIHNIKFPQIDRPGWSPRAQAFACGAAALAAWAIVVGAAVLMWS